MFNLKNVAAVLVVPLLCSATAWAAPDEFNITLGVVGADPDVGKIMASLYDSAESYMEDSLVDIATDVDEHGSVRLNLGSHAPGQFAIVIFYDKNENGNLDTNFIGIPKEKVGFSNNAKGRFGPAMWADARFLLERANLQVEIELIQASKN